MRFSHAAWMAVAFAVVALGGCSNAIPKAAVNTAMATVPFNGAFDAVTHDWFETYCSGLQPWLDLATLMSEKTRYTDGEFVRLGQALGQSGTEMIYTASDLGNQIPPTFPGGAEHAEQTIADFTTFGNALIDAGGKVKAGLNDGGAELLAALSPYLESPIGDISGLQNADSISAAMADVPSCAGLG